MNRTYLDMIQGHIPSYTPVWYMRQAGRSQAKYRKIKEKYSLFDITRNPELCAYVTQLPVEEYGVDAAILYKDIMSPMEAMGVHVELKPGIGPVFAKPIQSASDLARIGQFDPSQVDYIAKTIQLLTRDMLDVPLIGFGGAPFTIASYLIEGGPTKNYNKTRGLMLGQPLVWDRLMGMLAHMTVEYLSMQVEAGAQALQIFDSWIGAVNQDQYKASIYKHMEYIFTELKSRFPQVPISMHGVGTAHLINQWAQLPLELISLDWRCSIEQMDDWGIDCAVQGNLDPAYLYADKALLMEEVDRILLAGVKHGRHVFNLGHGVFPEADPGLLHWLTEYVHERSRELRAMV